MKGSWREDQLETDELSLRTRRLTQEIVQAESRSQDLCEDLEKKEIVHCEKKVKVLLYFL